MPDDLMNISEVQAALRVSRQTVYRMRKSGELPEVRISAGIVRFRREDVDRLCSPTTEPESVS